MSNKRPRSGGLTKEERARARKLFGPRTYVPRLAYKVGGRSLLSARMGAQRGVAIEKKFVDLNDAAYTLNTTAQFTLLNGIAEGAGQFNRIGRKVQLKSLYLTGMIESIRTQADDDMARIMVIYDRQTNGLVPGITDVLQSVQQDGTTTSSGALDHLNLNNSERFLVLMDKRVLLPAMTWTAGVITNNGLLSTAGGNFLFKKFIKLKNLETHFKGTAAPTVVAQIATGSLYLVTLVGNKAAGAEGYELNLGIRLRFVDV